MSSRFSKLELASPVEVFALNEAYKKDNHSKKVNLGIGAFCGENGRPWTMPVVQIAESILFGKNSERDYKPLPLLGLDEYTNLGTALVLGDDSPAITEKRAFGVQCVSGTGAFRVGAEFLVQQLGYKTFLYAKQSWDNYKLIFTSAGFREGHECRYWSHSEFTFDFNGFIEDLKNAPKNSVVVLQLCAHNPTGCDPSREQWKKIADVMEECKQFPFFDSAYQGFASGDVDEDAWAIRYFVFRRFELFCSQTFSKTFGLYNERVGNLIVVTNNSTSVLPIKSQIINIKNNLVGTPPARGSRIVTYILSNKHLRQQWKQNIADKSHGLNKMRRILRAELEALKTPGNWSHLTSQTGVFSYTGLNEQQSEYLIEKYHIYVMKSGRICFSGVTPSNVDYIANAINEAVSNII